MEENSLRFQTSTHLHRCVEVTEEEHVTVSEGANTFSFHIAPYQRDQSSNFCVRAPAQLSLCLWSRKAPVYGEVWT